MTESEERLTQDLETIFDVLFEDTIEENWRDEQEASEGYAEMQSLYIH